MPQHDVFLGAADWRHPAWVGAFYPEDMPAEWQLAYYNTQFPCVWLPHAVWHRYTPAIAQELAADTRPEFRFLLESGASGGQAVPAAFGPRLAVQCRADDPDLLWFEAGVDLRRLADLLRRRATEAGHTFLLSRDGDLATLDKVKTLLALLNLGPGDRVG